MVEIKPSRRAAAEIRSAAMSLKPEERTWDKIRELTGYPTPLIAQVLRKNRGRPKKIAAPKIPESEVRPKWAQEVAENTGLDLIKVRKFRHLEEWLLLTPTGIPIMRLIGTEDLLQSSIKLPNPAGVLQGLSSYQIDHRKLENAKKRKLK
jgi:hypothetical protein